MVEPTKLEIIKLRHRFVCLCYSLKLLVIPTGQLRSRLTKTSDARLFHPNSPLFKRKGTIKLLYNAVCTPFLCFSPLHHRPPLLPPPYHESANFALTTYATPTKPNHGLVNYTHQRPAHTAYRPIHTNWILTPTAYSRGLYTPAAYSHSLYTPAAYSHQRPTHTVPNPCNHAHPSYPAQKTRLSLDKQDSNRRSFRCYDPTHSSSSLDKSFYDENTHAERYILHSVQSLLTSLSIMANHSKFAHRHECRFFSSTRFLPFNPSSKPQHTKPSHLHSSPTAHL